jgi:predicted RNase H-like HicB family nuclease
MREYSKSSEKLIMKREFNVILERDADGYFVASVPNLPGCHTQAQTLDDLMERIREAIELCLEFEEEQHTPQNL